METGLKSSATPWRRAPLSLWQVAAASRTAISASSPPPAAAAAAVEEAGAAVVGASLNHARSRITTRYSVKRLADSGSLFQAALRYVRRCFSNDAVR